MLRNVRGGFSLRWMKVLLDNDIQIRAQIVLCPGVNDGEILDSTLAGLLEQYPTLESIAIVPLGLSRFNSEDRMRPLVFNQFIWQTSFTWLHKKQCLRLHSTENFQCWKMG